MPTVISIKNISKVYRLGLINGGTLRDDISRWGARLLKKPDPLLKIGEKDHGNQDKDILWALRDISFDVKQGEVLGIVGRNGAGKSTLLKILSQITAPTTGEIKIKGRIASLLEVGTGFHPELTGRENIFLNGAILGMSKAEVFRKLDEIIAFAEIEKFIDTPVKRYSSGMYVRLAFAVAAHLEPEILIIDEVLAVGDAEFQKKCLRKMGAVAKGGKTVMFVSHNMATIQGLCERVVLLESGKVNYIGATHDALARYLRTSTDGLSDIKISSPDGTVVLSKVGLMDKNYSPVDAVMSGSSVVFCLQIDSTRYIGGAIISIGIEDRYGVRISLLTNVLTANTIDIKPQTNNVYCEIPILSLCAGQYSASIKISGPDGVLIWKESCFYINVEAGDFFHTGAMLNETWMGSTLISHQWKTE